MEDLHPLILVDPETLHFLLAEEVHLVFANGKEQSGVDIWQVTQLLTASYLARMCPHQLRHEKKLLDRLHPGDGKRRGTISGMRKTCFFLDL